MPEMIEIKYCGFYGLFFTSEHVSTRKIKTGDIIKIDKETGERLCKRIWNDKPLWEQVKKPIAPKKEKPIEIKKGDEEQ